MLRRIGKILGEILALSVECVGRFLSFFFAHAKWTYPTAGVAFLLVVGAGALTYTENPRFCVTCHVMQPYYTSWKESSHNFVPCIECHYSPGMRAHIKTKFEALVQVIRYINGTYDPNFYAEIDDASCLRSGCHQTRLLQGKVPFKEGIIFDHVNHLTVQRHNITLRCTSCHSQLVIGSHIAVTEETCFICHFRGEFRPTTIKTASFCAKCHQPPVKTIDVGPISFNHQYYVDRMVACQLCHKDVVQGTGTVEEQSCMPCHSDFERVKKVTDPVKLHQVHVSEHKVECFECHEIIKHEVAKTSEVVATECQTCHENKHLGPRSLYMGVGGRGVPETPAVMFLAQVDCVACHTKFTPDVLPEAFGEQTAQPSEEMCVTCHGDFGKASLTAWRNELERAIKETEPLVSRARGKLLALPKNSPDREALLRKLDDAEYNLHLVVKGKGIHNVPYSLKLLEYSRKMALEVIELSPKHPY